LLLGKVPIKNNLENPLQSFTEGLYYVNNYSNSNKEKRMTPEAKVKASVVKLLKAYGIYYFFPATHGFGRSGVPDIIACYNSQFLAIECKAGKGKTTALQDKEINKIILAGGVAFVVNEVSIDRLKNYLEGKDIDMEGRC